MKKMKTYKKLKKEFDEKLGNLERNVLIRNFQFGVKNGGQ